MALSHKRRAGGVYPLPRLVAVFLVGTMGRYISQSDVENVFGTYNIARYSQLDNESEAADVSRITTAIAYAEEEVENCFRGGEYIIPFSGTVPKVVVNWCARLAGIWLFDNRGVGKVKDGDDEGHKFSRMKRQVFKDITKYTSGQRRMSVGSNVGSQPSGPMVVT